MACLSSSVMSASLRIPRLHVQCTQVSRAPGRHCSGGALLSSAFRLGEQLRIDFISSESRKPRDERFEIRGMKVFAARGKGFGDLVKRSKREGEGHRAASNACPCGGGKELKEYGACCGPFHGGVVELDALTVMKARFSAYSRGIVPYIVRTTHSDNPDFEGAEKLAKDVRATCGRLRFVKLDILDHEVLSESEAFVSFVAHYTLVKGVRGGDRKQLKEKSRFIMENGRWSFRETISLSQESEAPWRAATMLDFEKPQSERNSFGTSKAPIAVQSTQTIPPGS